MFKKPSKTILNSSSLVGANLEVCNWANLVITEVKPEHVSFWVNQIERNPQTHLAEFDLKQAGTEGKGRITAALRAAFQQETIKSTGNLYAPEKFEDSQNSKLDECFENSYPVAPTAPPSSEISELSPYVMPTPTAPPPESEVISNNSQGPTQPLTTYSYTTAFNPEYGSAPPYEEQKEQQPKPPSAPCPFASNKSSLSSLEKKFNEVNSAIGRSITAFSEASFTFFRQFNDSSGKLNTIDTEIKTFVRKFFR